MANFIQRILTQRQPEITAPKQEPSFSTNKSFSVSNPSGASLLAFGYAQNSTGQAVSTYTALSSSAVYACVKLISESISKLPIEITADDFQILKNHPVARLLRKPNELQNYVEFMQYIVTSHQLTGNAIVYIERNSAGDPVRLIPINPSCAQWNYNTHSGLPFYSIWHPLLKNGGIESLVPHTDIIHIKNFSIDYGYSGVSPIFAAANVIGVNLAQNKVVGQYFSQSAISTGIVNIDMDGAETPEAIAQIAAKFKERFQGSDNANGVIVAPKGVTFQPLQMNAADSQLLESRQFSVEEIARIFGVPLSKLSVHGDKADANYEQGNLSFTEDCLLSICTKIEEAFEDKLFFSDERDRLKIEFNFDEIYRTDAKTRAGIQQVYLLNGVLSINDVRNQEGLAPLPDEFASRYRVPANTVDPNNQDKIEPAAHVSPTGGASEENQPV